MINTRLARIKHPNLLDVNCFDVDICLFYMQAVVSVPGDHERLLHIQRVIKELPTSHFR